MAAKYKIVREGENRWVLYKRYKPYYNLFKKEWVKIAEGPSVDDLLECVEFKYKGEWYAEGI